MMPETVKTPIEELIREELIALLYEFTNRVRELEEKVAFETNTDDLKEFVTTAIAGFQVGEK